MDEKKIRELSELGKRVCRDSLHLTEEEFQQAKAKIEKLFPESERANEPYVLQVLIGMLIENRNKPIMDFINGKCNDNENKKETGC